jgi:hypothetical protein
MNTNCSNCDKPDCPTLTMPEESEWQNSYEEMIERDQAMAECAARAVNWRARCLAAEAELAKLREGLLDSIADNRQAATQSANEVLP